MKPLRASYFIVANTAMLLLLVEGGTHVAIRAMQRAAPEVSYQQLTEPVRRNYSHMAPADVEDLLRVTASLRYRYAPVGGFVHAATASRFVNIDSYGVRANGPSRRHISAMEDAVWVFGGSTTFGSGVADHETIPAQLENLLARPVMNLGVRGDGSLMENRLLNYYLRAGYRPAMALFLDGINEACQADVFADQLSALVARVQNGYEWEFGRPVTYAFDKGRRRLQRLTGGEVDRPDRTELTCVADGARNPLRAIHARTLAERDSLCRLYDIPCRTFVQPFAGLHGRHDDRAFVASAGAAHLRALFAHLEANWRAAGATFVTGALDRRDRHAFVDEIHYSADANRLIAEAMAASIAAPAAPPR
jgi:lysophospholipase L1-like esterase